MKMKSLLGFLVLHVMFVAVYSQGADKGLKTHVDKKNGFSFSYPKDFGISVGKKAGTETAFGDPGKGKKLLKVFPLHIPAKYHGEYEFNLWISSDPKDKCGAPEPDEFQGDDPDTKRPKTMTIGGRTFYTYSDSEGGMSKSMGLDGLRGAVNHRCWQIQSLTYQVSAFDDYKTFDYKIIQKSFEQFVKSFQFTNGK